MNKTELIQAMANESGLSAKEVGKALDAFIGTVADELKKGNKVQLVGFGTFEIGERAARTGRNPKNGETIEIAACKVPKFKAGKALKEEINK